MLIKDRHIYRFGEFSLDTEQNILLCGNRPVTVTPKMLELLRVLVENSGRILEKDDLMETVWADSFVEEGNLKFTVNQLRKALGDDARNPDYIETVAKRGYRFIAEIEKTSTDSKDEQFNFTPNNLSENLSPIIGRDRQIFEIKQILTQKNVRLLTLTGVGGTGKTTLAKAVAGEMLEEFADGLFLIQLAPIRNHELVLTAITNSLGLKESGGQPVIEILKEHLRNKKVLLILDNFEHLSEAATQVAELVSGTEQLKILVTSRTRLHLSAEKEFFVPPLEVPTDILQMSVGELSGYEAVQLFAERARNAKAGFILTEENARSVAEICARLDGLPLAIELAAARVKILSPQTILAKLENRLQLLTGGAKDLPVRQQTMHNAVNWSYELLTEDEKILFRRLSVFAGGFTFEAAEAVVQNSSVPYSPALAVEDDRKQDQTEINVLDLVNALVDKSLLIVKERSGGEMRFYMLEVVREFALDALKTSGETETFRQSHTAYFLALAEEAEPHLHGEQPTEWLNLLEAEHNNLQEALHWAIDFDREMAGRLAGAIRHFWTNRGYLTEGLKFAEEILKFGDRIPSEARRNLLNMAGNFAMFHGDLEKARLMYEQGLEEGRTAQDLSYISLSYRGLARWALEKDDRTEAQRFIKKALAAAREADDKFGTAYSLNMMGDFARVAGDNASACDFFNEALEICRQLCKTSSVSNILINLAQAEYCNGDYESATSHFAEGLRTLQNLGNKINISCALDGSAALAAWHGKPERAAMLAGAADQLRESIKYNIEPAERAFRSEYLAKLHATFSEKEFDAFYEKGRKLKLEDAITLALPDNENKHSYSVSDNDPAENRTKEITQLLRECNSGDKDSFDRLMPLVYDELHRLAARFLRRESKNHTLQTTALIHEAYLKLVDQRDVEWQNRAHFFAIASQAMRRILVDYARTKHREKRGGNQDDLPLEEALTVAVAEKPVDLIALDEALTRLAEIDERQVRVVELRFFGDLSLEETAEVLDISRATAAREWNVARAWLHRELTR